MPSKFRPNKGDVVKVIWCDVEYNDFAENTYTWYYAGLARVVRTSKWITQFQIDGEDFVRKYYHDRRSYANRGYSLWPTSDDCDARLEWLSDRRKESDAR